MMLNASHSYLQLLQYIRSSIRYANAFTPHWMEWNCLIYKDRYSTGSYHVLFVTHVVKETKATQSLLCIVFCLLRPHYFQLRHRRHSLKSHHSPLHPVCQQTSQRTDNSLPGSYSSFSASSPSSFHAVPTRDFNAAGLRGEKDGASYQNSTMRILP